MPSPKPIAGPGRPNRPRLPFGAAIAALLALAVLLLAGCGDDETTSTTAVSDGTTTTTAVEESDQGSHHVGLGSFSAQDVYSQAAPSVVTIRSIFGNLNSVGGSGGQGSGFVISDDGEIVTNAHVVTDAEQGGGAAAADGEINAADEVFVEFPDRNQVEAEIVGFDPNADVALLKVDPEGLDLRPLEFGDSAAVEVGTPVAAIGSPFGQEQSLSTGIVSATDRSIDSLTAFAIDGALQTDASINPGNSGGPLIDADGKVIGINQQINTTSGGNEGVGFAVPSNLVQRSVEDLRPDGEAEYAFIGVSTIPLYPQLAERLDVDAPTGALVVKTTEGGPAADAGIKGAGGEKIEFQGQEINVGGDVIVAVNGEELESETDLSRLISQAKPGDQVQLEVIRDGDRQTIDVTLEARPDSL